MKRKNYLQPQTEVVTVKLYGDMLASDEGLIIPVSGGTTPEESDAKPNNAFEEDINSPSSASIWDD